MEYLSIIIPISTLIIAIVGHEIMHGRIAYKYGDTTAKNEGRFSVNPLKHIDPIGSIAVPLILYISGSGILFGWAKPVPVNMHTVVRNAGHKGAIHVALAGIIYNILVAILAISAVMIIYKMELYDSASILSVLSIKFLMSLFMINIVLAIFNLFPIPPLDGSKVVLHTAMAMGYYKISNFIYKYEQYGMILLMGILFLLPSLIWMPINKVILYLIQLAIRIVG